MLDVLVGTPEDGVVEGGGELADPAAKGVHELSGHDRPGLDVPLLFGPLADEPIEVELVAGKHQMHVDGVGHLLDVRHTRGTAGVIGRERRDQVVDVQALQILGGDVRVGVLDERKSALSGPGEAGLEKALGCLRLVDACAPEARLDTDVVFFDDKLGIDRRGFEHLPEWGEVGVDDCRIEGVDDLR